MQTFSVSLKSANTKVGQIPVSMSNSSTCPNACPLKKNGCYAAQGAISWIWQALDRGFMRRHGKSYTFGKTWIEFVNIIKSLPNGVLWRHNQVGDLVGENDKIDAQALKELVEANDGKKGFTYTHYPMTDSLEALHNQEQVKNANEKGFTINLSSNSLKHADKLKALNIAPIVTLLPSDFVGEKGFTPQGNRFIVCPSQTKGVTCKDCQLCSKQRSIIIGFKAHGVAKNKVDAIA